MNKLISTIFVSALCLGSYSAIAATTPENTDDASSIGTSDTPQLKQQNMKTTNKGNSKGIARKNRMHNNDAEMKMMDSNNDGMISKDEYMNYHEQAYGSMKQGDNGVSMKDMSASMRSGSYKSSMNNKPMGTTSGTSSNGSVDITKDGAPVNGTHEGTN